jgi:hypothetical protein
MNALWARIEPLLPKPRPGNRQYAARKPLPIGWSSRAFSSAPHRIAVKYLRATRAIGQALII